MVINYKRLDDNTRERNYKLPSKDLLINKIQGKSIFSKFDLQSGFHQIKMTQESIPWTAFCCPNPIGHWEYNVMPFGLKNAPAVFQERMDRIFSPYDFIIVYVDDILVFSSNPDEHRKHLKITFDILEAHGLVVSKSKIKLAQKEIEFLGTIISRNGIQLQDHIAKKTLSFPDDLTSLKEIQSFCGLVNQARSFIPNLGRLLGPIYLKTKKNGERRFNKEDIKIIQKIKKCISSIPKLSLPLDSDFLIVESDGSATGWGAVLKKKPNPSSLKSSEEICRYGSGIFKEKSIHLKSTDYEVLAIIYALKCFELYLLSKDEFIIRTDCQAIVSYYNNSQKLSSNFHYRNRWYNLIAAIQGRGFKVKFEHIRGKDNGSADTLSRMLND